MKAVKADKLEVEKDICNDASEEVFQGGYRANRHYHLFLCLSVSSAIWPEDLCIILLRLMVSQGVCVR